MSLYSEEMLKRIGDELEGANTALASIHLDLCRSTLFAGLLANPSIINDELLHEAAWDESHFIYSRLLAFVEKLERLGEMS